MMYSFDIVSEYDKAELNNVFDQSRRQLSGRYDFKGTPAAIEWLNSDKTGIKLTGNSDMQLDALIDIFRTKLSSRGQSQKLLDTTSPRTSANLMTTQEIGFKSGLDQPKAKQVTSFIRDKFPKAKTTIQGDLVRVSSSSKDELQAVIALVKSADFDFPLSLTNYR